MSSLPYSLVNNHDVLTNGVLLASIPIHEMSKFIVILGKAFFLLLVWFYWLVHLELSKRHLKPLVLQFKNIK